MNLRFLISLFIRLIGVTAFVLAGIASMTFRHARSIFVGAEWLPWLVALVSSVLGFWLWKMAKQLRSVPVNEILEKDKRLPILYLRSFKADSKADKAAQHGFFAKLFPMTLPQNLLTEEEQIAQVMSQLGPFIAIGRPGELLPQLGAARMYVAEEDWRQTILDFLNRSQLVVMRVGETEGFWWEVASTSALPDPQKLIFLLPTSESDYERFRTRAGEFFPKPFPETYKPKIMTDRTFGGVMWFEEDWTPKIALCGSAININRYSVAVDLKEKLSPVLSKLQDYQFVVAPLKLRLAATVIDILIFSVIVYSH